jgi:hypothetical protein
MAMHVTSRLPSAAANGRNGHSLISDDKFRQLYALTLKLRRLTQSGNGAVARRWLRGSEAALAAVAADLRPRDVLVSPSGSTLCDPLPRGVVMPAISRFDDSIAEAIAAAVAARLKKTAAVSVLVCAEASAETLLREAYAIAARARLPLLFIERGLAENGRAVSPKPAAGAHESESMPAIPVDAQDVVAIYRVAHESMTRARAGSGPTRIQCVPWVAPLSSRKESQAASADAVEHLERWLIGRGLPAEQWRREIAAEMENNTAHQQSQRSADPPATNGSGDTTERPPQSFA